MPYKVEKRSKKWCVVKDDGSGTSMGCHDTEAQAKGQLSALYANEPEAEVENLFKEAHDAFGEDHPRAARLW